MRSPLASPRSATRSSASTYLYGVDVLGALAQNHTRGVAILGHRNVVAESMGAYDALGANFSLEVGPLKARVEEVSERRASRLGWAALGGGLLLSLAGILVAGRRR